MRMGQRGSKIEQNPAWKQTINIKQEVKLTPTEMDMRKKKTPKTQNQTQMVLANTSHCVIS